MAKTRQGGRTFVDWLKVGGQRLLPADMALLSGMGAANQRIKKVARVALAAVDTGGGVFSWQNPEAMSIIVNRLTIDVTTDSTGACTVDAGTTATSATTPSDNLIDGLDVGTAAILADNLGNAGTNGKTRQKLAAGKWVTGSVVSGASAGIVGFAYIEYQLI